MTDKAECADEHGGEHLMVGGRCLLSAEWIRTVAKTPENDLRAHRIALSDSRYALRLDAMIHGEKSMANYLSSRGGIAAPECNANWFHFASWGTLTVSRNIANEGGLQRLNAGLGLPLRRALTPAVLNVKASAGQRVARGLAWAQRLIFVSGSVALRAFSRGIGRPEELFDASDLALLTELSSWHGGEPHIKPDRHHEPVERAFELYRRAIHAQPLARARLILGGNLLLTEVEQDLADPALSVVVDLVPKRVAGAMDWQLAKLAQRVRGIPTHFSYLVLPYLHTAERKALDLAWSRFMTDQVLVMALPTETLRLGRDIPPREKGQPYFPRQLRDLDAVADADSGGDDVLRRDLEEVARHVRSLDRTVGDGRGSAARDWRRWDERLNWAVTLLRSRQQDETLFWQPYSEADARRIVSGELPRRSGDPSALDIQPPIDGTVFNRVDLESRGTR